MEVVYSDPYGQLPFRSDKYSSTCEEIYLGEKGINVLRDFESFVSLSVLWLNDNSLESLEGLEENFRLKEIYAHGNKIQRLHEDAFAQCTFLGRLTLSNNKLDDLENVLEELRPMNHLKNLDLFDNPIAQEDNYRLRVIGELPTLTMLDRHEITVEERKDAKAFMKKMKKMHQNQSLFCILVQNQQKKRKSLEIFIMVSRHLTVEKIWSISNFFIFSGFFSIFAVTLLKIECVGLLKLVFLIL